jgi:2-phosphosulfolactate phosphatase
VIVEVAFLPDAALEPERKVAVVVDALRASATIVAMFEAGAAEVLVAATPDEALRVAATDRTCSLVCGERGGVPPPGFDHGNSPSELSRLDFGDRRAILCTSNGTRALRVVGDARAVFVGTGRNGPAVAGAALDAAERAASDLVIVCAGDEHGALFSLEDCFFAGYLVDLLAARRAFTWPVDEADPRPGDPTCWVLDESALAARRLYRSYLAADADAGADAASLAAERAFREARNGHTLPRLGYVADLSYCAAADRSSVIPLLERRDGRLVLRVAHVR